MSGNPWHYFAPYQKDIHQALQDLKEQEFRAGRYGFDYWFNQMSINLPLEIADTNVAEFLNNLNQANRSPDELIEEFGSVKAAMEAILDESMPDGTQSIVDMTHVSEQPESFAVCPLSENELQTIFRTTQPSRKLVESLLLNEEEIDDWQPWEMFWESIDRGTGRYIVLYSEEQPSEIFFAGYSFD